MERLSDHDPNTNRLCQGWGSDCTCASTFSLENCEHIWAKVKLNIKRAQPNV